LSGHMLTRLLQRAYRIEDASPNLRMGRTARMDLRKASAKSGKYRFADSDDADRIRVGNAQCRGGR